MNFDDNPGVLVMIVVYSLLILLVMVPLAGELGKRKQPATEPPELEPDEGLQTPAAAKP
jgi:hypothetical protein